MSVSYSEVHKADEVSEVRLVGEIDDELVEVSEVRLVGEIDDELDEVSEVRLVGEIDDELDEVSEVDYGQLTNNRYTQREFKFSTILKAYDVIYTENDSNITFIYILVTNY